MGIYGCEASQLGEAPQKRLTTAIQDTASNHVIHKDTNAMFATSSARPDLDPEVVVLASRISSKSPSSALLVCRADGIVRRNASSYAVCLWGGLKLVPRRHTCNCVGAAVRCSVLPYY